MRDSMVGSAAYARSYLKTDLRNTRAMLGLIEDGRGDDAAVAAGAPDAPDARLAELERLVHDLTVGLRESGAELAGLDIDALRRYVEAAAESAARARDIADDTLRQWARSFERLLPWWQTLPPVETLLDDARWPTPAPGADAIEVEVSADERFRVTRVQRTHDAVTGYFDNHIRKHPGLRIVRFVDDAGDVVATLAALDDGIRWT